MFGDFTSTSAKAALVQHCFQLIGRTSVLQTEVLRADVFAAVGGTNTGFKIEGPTSNLEITRNAAADFLSSPMYTAGASAGVGFNNVYLTAEVGYERNNVTKMKQSGNITTGIGTIDLSGLYGMVSIMFDGIPYFKK